MSATDDLIKQILASSNTSKWSGEGYGSAQANAADMAKILSSIGITDIHQFGKIPQYETRTQYQGQDVRVDDDGNPYIMVPGAGLDDYGNPMPTRQNVDPKDVKQEKVKVGETFGNVKTGQEVPNTYSERQTGNFFGGTFAGKGNTGYGVQFRPDGTPVFYTQGASSNDIANIMKDLGPVGNIAAAALGGPMAVAALSVASGKPIQDVLKSAALSYLGGQAGDLVSGTSGISDVLGKTGTDALAGAAKQFVASGGKTDPTQLLLGAGLNYGANTIGDALGLSNLTDAQKKMLNTALSGVAGKQSLDQILMNVAMTGVMNQGKAPGDQMTVTRDPANLEDFLMSLNQYKTDQNADASGQGYYDEITGKFIKDDLGGLLNPLDNTTGNFNPTKDWEYKLTKPGVWTNDEGDVKDMTYLPNTETALTGDEIMRRAGALPGGSSTKVSVPTKKTTTTAQTPSSTESFKQVAQAPSQDPFADIKSMEDIFGGNIDYRLRSLGSGGGQKTASSDLDALTKLLRG
jgi:hypothetical protein